MPQKTKTGVDGLREVPNFVWAMFAVLVLFVYFFGLTIPFVGPDELGEIRRLRPAAGRESARSFAQ